MKMFNGIPGIIVKARFYALSNFLTEHPCKYVIQTTKGNGYFSIIQYMSLRSYKNGCRDYIQVFYWISLIILCNNWFMTILINWQFKRPNKSVTPKKCDFPNMIYDSDDFQSYEQLEGNVETEIFISQEKTDIQILEFSIVYTEFKSKLSVGIHSIFDTNMKIFLLSSCYS